MMKLELILLSVSLALINYQILPLNGIRRVRPGPIIKTENGFEQSQEEFHEIFQRIITFKEISLLKRLLQI